MVTTHARFAMKVQHKLRNGVAGRIISGSAESGQNLPISAMLLDPQNVRAEMPAEIDQLGIAGAAAQRRMVSAGEFCPSQQQVSRDLQYMARARLPEFESDLPSHAVCLGYLAVSLGGWCVSPAALRGCKEIYLV